MSPLRWTLLSVLGAGLGVGLGVGAHFTLPESPYVRGLMVGEHVLPASGEIGPFLDARRAAVGQQRVVLRYAEHESELTYADLGIDVDVAATLQAASAVGHTGSLVDRIKEARRARRGEIDVPLSYLWSEPKVRAHLEKLAERVRKEPHDAKLDIKSRSKIPDVPGRELDIELSLGAFEQADFSGVNGAVIDLSISPKRAKVTLADLANVDVEKTVSSHETTFATYGVGVGRTVNIERAAGLIDGVIILPGATISFNDLVGPRTLERGFALAPEIQGDEMTTGVGGGTCQVSSTLFIAALYGALDIVERRSHSRPSSYAKLGLDATVSYGLVDLKIKNPFTFPVMIHAHSPKPGVIRVDILGGDPPAEVTYRYGVGHTEDFVRRITVKPHMKPGTKRRHQKGSRGYDVMSVVTIKWKNGRVEERTFFSGYRPAPEVYWVAPGFDEKDLPPLPDHAKGVEGRLAELDGAYTPTAL